MQTLHIQLKERTYPIYIGEGLLSQIQLIEPHLKQKHVAVITNTTVAPLYLDPLLSLLKQNGIKAFPIILPDGEAYKNQETLNLIYDALLKEKCERTVTLIALGGGVIGDITGYAAATYLLRLHIDEQSGEKRRHSRHQRATRSTPNTQGKITAQAQRIQARSEQTRGHRGQWTPW